MSIILCAFIWIALHIITVSSSSTVVVCWPFTSYLVSISCLAADASRDSGNVRWYGTPRLDIKHSWSKSSDLSTSAHFLYYILRKLWNKWVEVKFIIGVFKTWYFKALHELLRIPLSVYPTVTGGDVLRVRNISVNSNSSIMNVNIRNVMIQSVKLILASIKSERMCGLVGILNTVISEWSLIKAVMVHSLKKSK